MEAQVAIFEDTHTVLWASYPNQFIAMYQGMVVDHDSDESLLIQRVDKEYPDDIVLVRQVKPDLPSVLVVRSPRFVSSSTEDYTIVQD